jgi:light-regulated signal transduction histidine kinase (bacteriophytochrome)
VPQRNRSEHPAHREAFFAHPQKRSIGCRGDLFGRRKDGSEFPVGIGLNPLEIDDELCVLSAIVDLTQRKRAEQALEHYAAELERSNQELQQFAYVASHDLKEPLRMIGSYTMLLAEEYLDRLEGDARKYLRYITDGAARMTTLIDELLDYSRVGRTDDHFRPVNLAEVVRTVLEDLRVAIEESQAVIEVGELPVVEGNPTRLAQLFQNLLANAIKFRGDRPPRIRVACTRNGGDWTIAVEDDGIGIPREQHGRIFQLFQRLHTCQEYPGTGIGLAVCRKIVQTHGGRIWVESQGGQGTTFRFTLPRPRAAHGPASLRDSDPRPGETRPRGGPGHARASVI